MENGNWKTEQREQRHSSQPICDTKQWHQPHPASDTDPKLRWKPIRPFPGGWQKQPVSQFRVMPQDQIPALSHQPMSQYI